MKQKISHEFKDLVLWKLEAEVPPNFKLSIGNKGTFTKDELIEHVKKEDEIGELYLKMELEFMRSLISGKLTKTIAE